MPETNDDLIAFENLLKHARGARQFLQNVFERKNPSEVFRDNAGLIAAGYLEESRRLCLEAEDRLLEWRTENRLRQLRKEKKISEQEHTFVSTIQDILWPGGAEDVEWNADTLSEIAAAVKAHNQRIWSIRHPQPGHEMVVTGIDWGVGSAATIQVLARITPEGLEVLSTKPAVSGELPEAPVKPTIDEDPED